MRGSISAILILVVTCFPLYAVVFTQWGAIDIVYLYAIETLVITILNSFLNLIQSLKYERIGGRLKGVVSEAILYLVLCFIQISLVSLLDHDKNFKPVTILDDTIFIVLAMLLFSLAHLNSIWRRCGKFWGKGYFDYLSIFNPRVGLVFMLIAFVFLIAPEFNISPDDDLKMALSFIFVRLFVEIIISGNQSQEELRQWKRSRG